MLQNLFECVIFHIFHTANIVFRVYTSRHLSSCVASSEQFLVVSVVPAITLELSILSTDLPMEGMLQYQVVATSTWPGSLVRWGFYFIMAFPFAFICFVDLLLGWLSLPFDYDKTFNYNELIIVEICSGSSSYKLGW
jgi:hypothetical protein